MTVSAAGGAVSLCSLPVEVSRRARLRSGLIGVNWEVLHGRPFAPGGVVGVGSGRSQLPSRRSSGQCRAGSLRTASQEMTEILGACSCHNITGVAHVNINDSQLKFNFVLTNGPDEFRR